LVHGEFATHGSEEVKTLLIGSPVKEGANPSKSPFFSVLEI
jgi:hypothetical protein